MQKLISWYDLCLNKYKDKMGQYLLETLLREYRQEFPSSQTIDPFLEERKYTMDKLNDLWKLKS